MIQLVGVEEIEEKVAELPLGAVVVVCDPEPGVAAKVARQVVGFRTAVFVGSLSVESDRKAAQEFASEMFVKDGEVFV